MEGEAYLAALRADGVSLARAAEPALDRPVPSCPGWSVRDLIAHVGQVHRDKARIVRAGTTTRPPGVEDTDLTGPELLAWYREGLSDLLDALAGADPRQPAWSWVGDQRVAFWYRRMAHETAVHRWDAEHAAGLAPAPVDPEELGADGVAEVFDTWLGHDDPPYEGPAGTLHLHATDAPAEWLLTLEPPHVSAAPGHGRADTALRGTASDLDLLLWGRLPLAAVEVLGDAALPGAFLAWVQGR